MAQHTPGPWRWEVSTSSKVARLQAEHSGGLIVMDFERWGMRNAAPRFRDDQRCAMMRVEQYAVQRVPHHVGWDEWVNHPDALLIAAAPDLLEACKALLEVAKLAMPDTYFETDSRVKQAQAAIAKAEGRAARGEGSSG